MSSDEFIFLYAILQIMSVWSVLSGALLVAVTCDEVVLNLLDSDENVE